MIIGVGTDMERVDRIAGLLGKEYGETFLRRVLTEAERSHALRLRERSVGRFGEFVAGRWAAKEAVAKAFGCGIGGTLGFQDIEVMPDAAGKPRCSIADGAWARLGWRGQIHLSISHAGGWVTAFAVAEKQ